MKVKVAKIVSTRTIKLKDGREATVTKFTTTDGDLMETFGSVEAGKEYEGNVIENDYGKTLRIKPLPSQSKRNAAFTRGADVNAMLIAYGKDITVSLIAAGIIKDEDGAERAWKKFYALSRELYSDGAKEGAEQDAPATDDLDRKKLYAALNLDRDQRLELSQALKKSGVKWHMLDSTVRALAGDGITGEMALGELLTVIDELTIPE